MGFDRILAAEAVTEIYIWRICQKILEYPRKCKICEWHFCLDCSEEFINARQPCPGHGAPLNREDVTLPNFDFRYAHGQLKIRCKEGCGTIATIDNMLSHEITWTSGQVRWDNYEIDMPIQTSQTRGVLSQAKQIVEQAKTVLPEAPVANSNQPKDTTPDLIEQLRDDMENMKKEMQEQMNTEIQRFLQVQMTTSTTLSERIAQQDEKINAHLENSEYLRAEHDQAKETEQEENKKSSALIDNTKQELIILIQDQATEIADLKQWVQIQNSVIKEMEAKINEVNDELNETGQDVEYIGSELQAYKKRFKQLQDALTNGKMPRKS